MLRDFLRKYIYSFSFDFLYRILFMLRKRIDVAGSDETVSHIVRTGCSVSRYGDGELNMIFQLDSGKTFVRDTFQDYDERLAARLKEILAAECYDDSRHIVCLPYWFHSGVDVYRPEVRYFCEKFFCMNVFRIMASVNLHRRYYNANMTRFYMSYIDKNGCTDYVSSMKRIWSGRKVCFVEGEYSRLGVGNDLFDGASEIRRILCPSCNAYGRYDKILDCVRNLVEKDTLVLIALGHTATVLAYDLSNEGYQAIDLGHVDVEYEWMLMGATEKVPVKYRYVNEVSGGRDSAECPDQVYLSQVIARIS